MICAHRSIQSTKLLAIALLGTSVLTSCGLRPQSIQTESAPANSAASQTTADLAQAENSASSIPVPQPQLVQTASLGITVESIEQAIEQARTSARQHQGEVMNLQDQTPSSGEHHTATLQIRVPQAKLDEAIAAFANLGTVQQQSLTAEDVSTQLVDYQARLRNLRRAEETVLKIMDRSGSVGDVLEVARELNNIRQSIEQINAQLSSLQNQVRYSTIDLHLASTIATVVPQPSVQTQLSNTWKEATQSIGEFTVDLMQIGIWLMIYSPYLLLMIGAGMLLYRWRGRTARSNTP